MGLWKVGKFVLKWVVVMLLASQIHGTPADSGVLVVETVPDIVISHATLEMTKPSMAVLEIEIENRRSGMVEAVAVRLDVCMVDTPCESTTVLVREISAQSLKRRVFSRLILPGLPLLRPTVQISHVLENGTPIRVAPARVVKHFDDSDARVPGSSFQTRR